MSEQDADQDIAIEDEEGFDRRGLALTSGRVHAMLLSSRGVVVVWWRLIQAAMSSGRNGLMKKASKGECSLIGGACTDARITGTPGQ